MQIIARFDPSATTSGDFPTYLLSNGIGWIIVWNESNWNLILTFPNNDTDVCPAWTASIYALTGPQGRVTWAQDDQLASNNPPSSMVKVIAYGQNENVPGTYPLALVRQTTLGNTIAVGTGSTDIQNDGSVAGTSILETTVSGQTHSNQTWTNDSVVNLSLVIAGALVQWLKTQNTDPLVTLGAINHLVEILGSLTVDQNLTVTGTLTTGTFAPSSISTGTITASGSESVGGNLTVTGTSHLTGAIDIFAGLITHGGDIQAYNGSGFNSTTGSVTAGGSSNSFGTTTFTNGTDIIGGDHNFHGHNALNVGTLNLGTGSLSSISHFSGTGNGSFPHGLGTAPDIVLPNPCTAGASSQTIGIAKPYGATNVTITTGAGLAWDCIAIKF